MEENKEAASTVDVVLRVHSTKYKYYTTSKCHTGDAAAEVQVHEYCVHAGHTVCSFREEMTRSALADCFTHKQTKETSYFFEE